MDPERTNWFIRSVTEDLKRQLIWELAGRPENSDIILELNHELSLEDILVSSQAVREYLRLLWKKYQGSNRKRKSIILDELCRNLGLHRKAAIRLMNSPNSPRSRQGLAGGRRRKYSDEAKRHLAKLWRGMTYMCASKMKVALPDWIDFYEDESFTEEIKSEILAMSESSIKRFLAPARADLQRKRHTGISHVGDTRYPVFGTKGTG